MIRYVRVSIGTAAKLGLTKMKMLVEPTTAYLMMYYPGKCMAQCSFCTQACISSTNSSYLSRIIWPKYELNRVVNALASSKGFKRVCIQTIVYPNMISELFELIKAIKSNVELPISVSIHPRGADDIRGLKELGVDRIGIGLDVASPQLFNELKKPFKWDRTMRIIDLSVKILGEGKVTCHLIYGLGDSDRDFLETIYKLKIKGVNTSLFAFTPMEGTPLEKSRPPNPSRYRAIQLAHYLIVNGIASLSDFKFEDGILSGIDIDRRIIIEVIESCIPFITRGCPGCNRPFYNESPRGPIYNYPSIEWAKRDIKLIREQLRHLLR